MVENNPHVISKLTTSHSSAEQLSDEVDYPHSGLIKALNQLARGNIPVKISSGFNITQASSGNVVSVSAGQVLKDGVLQTATSVTNFTTGDFSFTTDNSYYLLVVNSSNTVVLRTPTAANRVADFSLGDTILAMIEISSSTSWGSRKIQFFTTDKESNGISIAYSNGGVFTEVGKLTGDANGITLTGLYKLDTLPTATVTASDKVLIQDTDDSDIIKTATASSIAALGSSYGDSDAISAVEGESTLDLTGAVTIQTDLKITTSSDDAIIENVTQDKDIIFKVNDGGTTTEVMRIDGSNGNVGIRLNQNTTAEERLDVEDGNISLTTTSRTTERIIKLRNSGSTTSLSEIAMAGANSNNYEGYIAFKTKGPDDLYNDPLNEIMRIDGNGKVGIGETAPSADLHIKSSANFDPTSAINTATLILEQTGGTQADDNESVGMTFTKINSGRPFGSIAGVQTGSDADVGGLAFFTHDASTSTDTISEKMRIDGNGNVGIGTTSPDTKLHIEASSNPTLKLQETGQNGYLEITSVVDSQAKITATNETASEFMILDIDAKANASTGTFQDVRLFRNAQSTVDGNFRIKQVGSATDVFHVYSDKDGTDHTMTMNGATTINGGLSSTGIRSAVAEAIGNSGPANHTFDSDDYFLHTKSIASTPPNPPNSVNISIPAASATIIGQRYRILCSANAGGIDDVVIAFDSGDSVYDATHTAGSTTQSLTGGKLYDIICVSGSEWFLLVLN